MILINHCLSAGPEEAPKICYKCKKVGHLSRDCPEHPDGTIHSHSNGVEDRRVDLDNSATEMDRVAMEEDDIHEIGEEEKGKLNDVDYLTGNPLPNDILLYAVPVCGPYSALQTYKYRVKIIPGTAKKGKGINMFEYFWDSLANRKGSFAKFSLRFDSFFSFFFHSCKNCHEFV